MAEHWHRVEVFEWQEAAELRSLIESAQTVEALRLCLLAILQKLSSQEVTTSTDDCNCDHAGDEE